MKSIEVKKIKENPHESWLNKRQSDSFNWLFIYANEECNHVGSVNRFWYFSICIGIFFLEMTNDGPQMAIGFQPTSSVSMALAPNCQWKSHPGCNDTGSEQSALNSPRLKQCRSDQWNVFQGVNRHWLGAATVIRLGVNRYGTASGKHSNRLNQHWLESASETYFKESIGTRSEQQL